MLKVCYYCEKVKAIIRIDGKKFYCKKCLEEVSCSGKNEK